MAIRYRSPVLALTALSLLACPAEKLNGNAGQVPGEAKPETAAAARAARAASSDGFAMAEPEVAPVAAGTDAPLSLTASDGTGLRLLKMKARGVVEGPLAFTELELAFQNPEPRVREGRFRITLPEGASISRFAMKIHGRWQEGEVVERQKARRTYEDFLHRRQDPALLEQAAGNEFTARVFPIPAGGIKELIVSFSHSLPRAADKYKIPLRGLPQLDELDIQILVGKQTKGAAATSLGGTTLRHETVTVTKSKWVPDLDFEVEVPAQTSSLGLRHDNLAVARVKPVVSAEPDAVHGLLLLVDTSASRALGFSAQLRLVRRLVDGLVKGSGGDTPLMVAAFDQAAVEIYRGDAEDYDSAAHQRLADHRALGASNLQAALQWVTANGGGKYDRLVLVTDGVATAGATEGGAVLEAAQRVADAGVKRIDAIAQGGLRDSDQLAKIVTALPRDGKVLDGALPLPELGHRLSQSTASGLKVEVEGAKWVWPTTLDGVQPGDEVLVFADLPAGKPFSLRLGGREVDLGDANLTETPRPLLERAWVRARIARLLHQRDTLAAQDPDLGQALKRQVIELSTRHRVLSPYTALLVLETEQDYRRYGITRNALANILTVGPQGLTVTGAKDRMAQVRPPPRPVRKPTPRPRPTARRNRGPRGGTDGLLQGEAEGSGALDSLATGRAGDTAAPQPSGAPATAMPPAPVLAERESDASKAVAAAPRSGASMDFDDRNEEVVAAEPEPEPSARPDSAPADEEAPRARPPARARRRQAAERSRTTGSRGRARAEAKKKNAAAFTGPMAEVMDLLGQDKVEQALAKARAWREEKPGDVLALVALGEALEKQGDLPQAARAYGSIVDLFPARADLLRFAANRLESVASAPALELAKDVYAKAVAQRADHPSGHRGLAFALVKLGDHAAAFEALEVGLRQRYPNRFPGVQRILREDLGLVAAAWKRADPKRTAEIERRVQAAGGSISTQPSLRFVLTWETDANDVDFHIHDGQGGHAYYSSKSLGSGGTLYADITTGYGPECFTIPGVARAFPYRLEAHYYRKGPMGYGMGRLQVLHHDGKGNLRFEERPFVVMNDGAYVDLGQVTEKSMQRD